MKFLFIIASLFTVTFLVSNSNAQNYTGAAGHCTAYIEERANFYSNGSYQPKIRIVNNCRYAITAYYITTNGGGGCTPVYNRIMAPGDRFRPIIPPHLTGTAYFVKGCTDFYNPNLQAASGFPTCYNQGALSSCF